MEKKFQWKIDVQEKTFQKCNDQWNEEWKLKRLRMMLFDFYTDILKKKFEDETTLQEINLFIDNWIKLHFQY